MMPISRRRALQLASAGVTASVLGGLGLDYRLRQRSNSPFVPATGADLLEPVTLRSCDGRLRVRLEAAEGYVQIAGRPAIALSYNGGVPGPTLRVQAGDRLELELVNRLSQPTNLHTHGLNVSPDGNADNVFVRVEPGASFDYDYQLPPDHPPGVFWYHPHHHGMVADQVFGGLFGSIIIDDPAAAAEIAVTRERLLVISDVSLDSHWRIQRPSPGEVMSGREGELILVNGQSVPRMSARPGDRERWRIVNACVARYVRLRLDSQHIQLLGIDSGRFSSPKPRSTAV